MKLKGIILLVFAPIVLILTSCAKDEGICVGSTGKVVTQERTALPFHSVEVYDNIKLILTQDTSLTRITVEAGENLIEGITTKIDSGKLVIRNVNSCNWLRSFEVPVNVYLKFTRLDTIVFRAAGNISCTNEWTNESVWLDVYEGAGQIDLKLNVFQSYVFVRYGTVAVNITGISQVTTLISHAYGPLHAENLSSKFTYVSSYSPNDVFVNSTVELSVEIGNIGNVYYSGDPPVIYTNIIGGGKLIKF